MFIAPAVGLGIIFIFGLGFLISVLIGEWIKSWRKKGGIYSSILHKKDIEKSEIVVGVVVGAAFVVAFIILIIRSSPETQGVLWVVLTILGIVVSILSFMLAYWIRTPKVTRVYTPKKSPQEKTQEKTDPKAPKYPAKDKDSNASWEPPPTGDAQDLRLERAEYHAELEDRQKRRIQLQQIKDDFYAIVALPVSQYMERYQKLGDIFNRLFEASDIILIEPSRLDNQISTENFQKHKWIISFDNLYIWVEMICSRELIGPDEVSKHIANLSNQYYSGSMLITNTQFTPKAHRARLRTPKNKFVVLCEMEEIVGLFETQRDLKEFCREKIRSNRNRKNIFQVLGFN